jgi:hypothetical protein
MMFSISSACPDKCVPFCLQSWSILLGHISSSGTSKFYNIKKLNFTEVFSKVLSEYQDHSNKNPMHNLEKKLVGFK